MNRSDRPLIKIENDIYNIIIEIICGLLIIITSSKVITNWINLPKIIPSHFNSFGEINGFGSKNFIFILPSVMIFIFIMFTILEKFPHRFNYPVIINNKNAEKQYRLSIKLLKIIKIEIIIIFSYLSNTIINSAIEKKLTINPIFPQITIIMIFTTIILYTYLAKKNK